MREAEESLSHNPRSNAWLGERFTLFTKPHLLYGTKLFSAIQLVEKDSPTTHIKKALSSSRGQQYTNEINTWKTTKAATEIKCYVEHSVTKLSLLGGRQMLTKQSFNILIHK